MTKGARLDFRAGPGTATHSNGVTREALLDIVAVGLQRFNAACLAYCLRGNHDHFVVQTRSGKLSRFMRRLNGVNTQRYNRRHGKIGHVFQGRYKAVLVDRGAHFLEVCRYVDLNPVRARMVRHARDWAWGSYRAHAGLTAPPDWLHSEELHRQFAPRAPRREGPAPYAQVVAEGKGVDLWREALTRQIYLGSERFAERMQAAPAAKPRRPVSKEVPQAQRRVRPIDAYFAQSADRDAAILHAYRAGGHTQTSIVQACGLSVSRVSRVIAKSESDVSPKH